MYRIVSNVTTAASKTPLPPSQCFFDSLHIPSGGVDVEFMFGWEKSRFSRVTRSLAQYLYLLWKHILHFDHTRLTPQRLQEYADIIRAKGAPADNIWGFIDTTLRKTSRTVRNQHVIYNEWKRKHGLKYLTILTPDGLHAYVFGPVEGARYDWMVYNQSGLTEILHAHSWGPSGNPLFIYGDAAFGVDHHLRSPLEGAELSPEQRRWNYGMSRVRQAVEWGYADVIGKFAYLDFARNQRILLQPVGIFYTIALLMCNVHTIMHKSQTTRYFSCNPPPLVEYFHGDPDNMSWRKGGIAPDIKPVGVHEVSEWDEEQMGDDDTEKVPGEN